MSFEPPAAAPQFQQPQFPRSMPTNGFAITSMVMGILGFIVLYGLGSILALVFGYIAKSQIKNSPTPQEGNGLATAGIVMGWIGIALGILLIAGLILFVIAFPEIFNEIDVEGSTF
jgi:hypothetical protein